MSWSGGRCLVVLGPNGAGKTTLLRVLAALVKPDTGTVHVAGYDRRRQPMQVRSSVGFLSHQSFLYDELTPRENLRFYARLYSVPDVEARVSQVLGQVEIGAWAERRVRTLSNGMQKAGSRWPERCCTGPGCSCWTSRKRGWTSGAWRCWPAGYVAFWTTAPRWS